MTVPGTTVRTRNAFAACAVVAFVAYMIAGLGTDIFYDEWDWAAMVRGLGLDQLLTPHNGHLSAVPYVYYKGLLELFGAHDYWIRRALMALEHIAIAWCVMLLIARRQGAAGGLLAGAFVLFMGAAADDILWFFQAGFLTAILGGLVMWLALDHRSGRATALALAALLVSLGSAGLGLVFLGAAALELLFTRQWRRFVIIIGPAVVLYGAWYLAYGKEQSQFDIRNLGPTPRFALDVLATGAGGVFGLSMEYGRALVAGIGILAAINWTRGRTYSVRGLSVLAAVVAFGVLTGLSRAGIGGPEAGRYIYPTGILLVVAFGFLAPQLVHGHRERAWQAMAAVLVISLPFSLAALATSAKFLREQADDVRAEFGAFDLIKHTIGNEFKPAKLTAPQVDARHLIASEARYGSIADSPAEIVAAPAHSRLKADITLNDAGNLKVGTLPGVAASSVRRGTAGTDLASPNGTATASTPGCLASTTGSTTVTVPGDVGIKVASTAGGSFRTYRFADPAPDSPPAPMPAGVTTFTAPEAAGAPDWKVTIESTAPVTVCAGASS